MANWIILLLLEEGRNLTHCNELKIFFSPVYFISREQKATPFQGNAKQVAK